MPGPEIMPSIELLSVLLLAALPLMGSPGPATMSLAATGAAYGVRRGVPYYVGIVFGTTAVLVMVASGLTGLILAVPGVEPVILAVGCIYILYLAYRIATAPTMAKAAGHGQAPTLYGGLLLALANPKAYAAIGAVFSSVVISDQVWLDGAAKVVTLTAVIVVVNLIWLTLGATLAGAFRAPRIGRAINVGFAVLLVASVALAVLA